MINTIEKMNELGSKGCPFFFIFSFDQCEMVFYKPHQIHEHRILYDMNGFRNVYRSLKPAGNPNLKKFPVSYDTYLKAFRKVRHELLSGNTYLLNLTFRTPVETDLTLKEIFLNSRARYKLYFRNFTVFSPETFIQIRGNRIHSFPMKGTIDASVHNAHDRIMEDFKEQAEHATIVDLIRNDLSIVADNVTVDRYRYVEEIETHERKILQVSSQISGDIKDSYRNRIGDLLMALLPAGSVTGAPKRKTVEIIRKVEDYDRGFYTGVFGYFDGKNLDSAVMIRYIEKEGDKMYYKSGGGITANSNPVKEYHEMIDKIYVPVY